MYVYIFLILLNVDTLAAAQRAIKEYALKNPSLFATFAK